MKPYTVLLQARVVRDLSAMESAEVERFWRFVAELEANPFIDGDFEDTVEDVPVKAKVLGTHSILFAVDHPMREGKVLCILRSD